MTGRRDIAFLSICLAISVLGGCDPTGDYQRFEGATMGTYYNLTVRCPGDVAQIFDEVRVELDEVNAQMSTYLPDSELSRFNNAPVGEWQPVSGELVDVVTAARTISELSGGAFDVTVGPLINLWGFGPNGEVAAAPDTDAINAAIERVGYQFLETRSPPAALRKQQPVYVDLSAIAKGRGVDRVARLLDQASCTDYLVDVGGEVVGRGVNPTGQAWRVGVEVPDPDLIGAVQKVLVLRDAAIATSGDYRNFLDLEGVRFSHTIDPRSGRPVAHLLASVSVIHESAMWADGLATALNVLGPEAGFQLAEEEGLAAFFLIRRAAGFEERYTQPMRIFLETQQ